jgi:hypothetical protein
MAKRKQKKDYKQFKKNYDEASSGAGDTIAKITKATGIEKAVKFIAGKDCGCDERKDKLNNMFPYYKPNCLTEDEYNYIGEMIDKVKSTIPRDDVPKLLAIYNRVFNDKKEASSCSSCFANGVWNKLKTVYNEYN